MIKEGYENNAEMQMEEMEERIKKLRIELDELAYTYFNSIGQFVCGGELDYEDRDIMLAIYKDMEGVNYDIDKFYDTTIQEFVSVYLDWSIRMNRDYGISEERLAKWKEMANKVWYDEEDSRERWENLY